MAIWLLWERNLGEDSFFYPWLKLIPSVTNIPMQWSRIELDELKGTYIYDRVLYDLDGIIDDYELVFSKTLFPKHPELFTPEKYTLDDYIWAWNILWSRDIEIRGGGTWTAYLVPFIDFVNHNPNKNIDITLNFAQTEFLIRSNDTLSEGDELLRTYVPLVPNSDLLRTYGFIDPTNNHGATALEIEFDPSDIDKELRMEWLEKYGIEHYPYPYSNFFISIHGVPNNVMAMLRVLSYDFDDPESSRDLDKLPDPFKPAQESLEQAAYFSLKHRLTTKLESLPSSYEEDLKLLDDSTLPLRKQLAVEARVEERVALMNALETLQSQRIKVGKPFKVGDRGNLITPKRSAKRQLL